jgi:N-acyl-D-aspartate/D-glutamate deacylase
MARLDTVICGGLVIDGTRAARKQCDVGIRDGRVTELGQIPPSDAERVIDASGCIVAPGFVDLHTHYDAQIFWDPYCTLSGWHGVTSVVTGNCGFGFAPVAPEHRDRSMQQMTRVEAIPFDAMKAGIPWTWTTFPEFLDALEKTPKSINVRPFMPVGPLLCWVMGFERAKAGDMPTEAEHAEMKRLLHEAMDAGAGGWSAQRLEPGGGSSVQTDFDGTPMPTDVMRDETCLELADVLRERNDGFVQITLVKKSGVEATRAHVEELAERSGRPILFNAIVPFFYFPHAHVETLAWISDCALRGLEVYGQGLTTDAGFTFSFDEWNLFDEIDEWREATTGSLEERFEKLKDPARREALKDARRPFITLRSIESISVSEVFTAETEPYVGLAIGDIADAEGRHPIDVLLDIAVADGLKAVFYGVGTNDFARGFSDLMEHPYVLPGVSDGGAHTRFLTAGRYPTDAIIRACRENDILSLEDVHWKLSALPAACSGFTDRGTLEPGKAADIVVYDFDALDILPVEKVHDFPAGEWRRIQRAKGYRYVLVNGEVTIEDDQQTEVHSGALLRNPTSAVNPGE